MENTFVVKDEPMTIRITIEIIPPKNKNAVAVEPINPQKDKAVAPVIKDETKVIPLEPLVEPIAPPKRERKPRAPKVKSVEETVVETVVDNKSTVTPISTDNKIVARVAKMIRFYCKAQGLKASDITIALLKEKAFDIIENVSDADVEIAIKEAIKAM